VVKIAKMAETHHSSIFPCPSDKKAVSRSRERWNKLSMLIRQNMYVGPIIDHPSFDDFFEIEVTQSGNETLCRWFGCRIGDIDIKIQCRSRRLVVTFDDLKFACNNGIDFTGSSCISSSEEELVKYVRGADPLFFEGMRVMELGAGVSQYLVWIRFLRKIRH
jgi:hypothetical protein